MRNAKLDFVRNVSVVTILIKQKHLIGETIEKYKYSRSN